MFRQGGGARIGDPHEPDAEENSNRRRSDDPERNEMKRISSFKTPFIATNTV